MTNNEPDYKDDLYFCNSQNTENEQQKDLHITSDTLTELWKKGELPLGWYFIKYKSKKIEPAEYMSWYKNEGWCFNAFECDEDEIEGIVDIVPYYDEFERLNNVATIATDGGISILRFIRNVKNENEQLKETISILKNKLLQVKPELEEWIEGVMR